MCLAFSTRLQDPVDPPPRHYKNYDSKFPVSGSSAYSGQRDQARTNKINEMNAASKEARARNKKQKTSFVLRNNGAGASSLHHGAIAGAVAGSAMGGGGAGGAGGF